MIPGANGVRSQHETIPAPWDMSSRPAPRDVIAEQIAAEVRRYWRRALVAGGAAIALAGAAGFVVALLVAT